MKIKFELTGEGQEKHRRAVENVIAGFQPSVNIVKLHVNYNIDCNFTVEFIQRLYYVTSLLQDPEVIVGEIELSCEGVHRMIEAGRAMQTLIDTYNDREIALRRYGEERDYNIQG
jgi:hypothetical protein